MVNSLDGLFAKSLSSLAGLGLWDFIMGLLDRLLSGDERVDGLQFVVVVPV